MIQANYISCFFTIVITVLLFSSNSLSFARSVDASENRTYSGPASELRAGPRIEPDLLAKPLAPKNIHPMILKVIDLSAQGKIEEASTFS